MTTKRISKMMTKGISKIATKEVSEYWVLDKLVAYFQCSLLLKTVYLKAETIVPAVSNLLSTAVVIVAFRNLSPLDVDMGL